MNSSLLLRTPLISVVRTPSDDPSHTRVSYYVGDTMIMDMDVLQDVVPTSGPVDLLLLTQLLVTPHEHLAVLADIVSLAVGKEVTTPRWDASVARALALLEGPKA